ncbi:MAG TPA: flavin reductase family protein [Solirubrobacterales bacterium]|nr:flavin reductase family protein [Solirubrobacterales bacterium]
MTGEAKPGRRELGLGELPDQQFAGLLKSVVVPRPIAWVSTTSIDGIDNLAPHSFFTFASEVPPILQFTSIGRHDSLRNALDTGEFVINLADFGNLDAVNASATPYPPDEDEFTEAGIEREDSVAVKPPRVASSPVAIECRTESSVDFGSSVVVFGKVVHLSISESVLVDGHPDIGLLEPLARLGKNEWSEIGKIHQLDRIPLDQVRRSGS